MKATSIAICLYENDTLTTIKKGELLQKLLKVFQEQQKNFTEVVGNQNDSNE